MVVEETTDTFKGKQGNEITSHVLSLQDRDDHARLKNSFDYNMRPEEVSEFSGKIRDKMRLCDVNEFVPGLARRLRARGRLAQEAKTKTP
jgi:hypothetical protein